MKSIELTSQQNERLLEMCQALFPEYNNPSISDGGFVCNEWSKDGIHWFEFCYTHLLSKIFNNGKYPAPTPAHDDTEGRIMFGNCYTWYNTFHPVDFLYEHFKMIKN